jgi:Flp pilus assembly protein CpaB
MKNAYALLLSVILGLVAVMGVHKLIVRERQRQKDQWHPEAFVVADRHIKEGTVIGPDHVRQQLIAAEGVASGTVLYKDLEKLVLGKAVNRDIPEGEVVMVRDLAVPRPPEPDPVPAGMRLFTVQVGPESGVAGLLRPKDYVDVIGLLREKEQGEERAMTLLQQVKVFSVGQARGPRMGSRSRLSSPFGMGMDEDYRTVTLLVTPRQAELLAYASRGEVILVKRNPTDASPGAVDPSGVGAHNLNEVIEAHRPK